MKNCRVQRSSLYSSVPEKTDDNLGEKNVSQPAKVSDNSIFNKKDTSLSIDNEVYDQQTIRQCS